MTKAQLHELIDALPEERIGEAVRPLALLFDPMAHALMTTPEDDEPEAERRAVAEAWEDGAAGRVRPWSAAHGACRRGFGTNASRPRWQVLIAGR